MPEDHAAGCSGADAAQALIDLAASMLPHVKFTELLMEVDEKWFGFDCVRNVGGLGPDVLMVPLPGHTFGHAGVAARAEGRWKLLAGDAYFYHREMDFVDAWCTPGLRMYQAMLEKNRSARLLNQQRPSGVEA